MSSAFTTVRAWWRLRSVRTIVLLSVSVLIGWAVLRIIGRVNWGAVGDAVSQVSGGDLAVLMAVLGLRLVFNAVSMARFVPGLGMWRAVRNDLSANLVATVAPPPGDVVLRVAQFRSWGVDPVTGMGGVTLSMVVFYGARFIAPVLGLVLVTADQLGTRQWVWGALSLVIAGAIFTALIVTLRSGRWAASLGDAAARIVGRFTTTVDTSGWREAVVRFGARMDATLRGNVVLVTISTLMAVILDGVILALSLRFMGVDAAQLPLNEILGAFLLVYPLTIMPLFGLGVLDATLIASWSAIAGDVAEPAIIAAAVIWRTVTIGGTLLLGVAAVGSWRWTVRRAGRTSEEPPDHD